MQFTPSPHHGLTVFNLGCFVMGITLMTIGIHYSYKYVEPQQARTKARSDLLRAHLIKKYGKEVIPKVFRNPPHSTIDADSEVSSGH
ncbi:hypothetical protein MKW92_005880 [Papaver armeniacum]|nr:hypothetical protein MKW92_005880 [Papaver armeniacum]